MNGVLRRIPHGIGLDGFLPRTCHSVEPLIFITQHLCRITIIERLNIVVEGIYKAKNIRNRYLSHWRGHEQDIEYLYIVYNSGERISKDQLLANRQP